MESKDAIARLAALAQETRLSIFRLLVRHNPEGLTPGLIADELALPAPTLSFHLRTLAQAGLVTTEQEGRYLRYRADLAAFNSLTAFLTEDCCRGSRQTC